MSEQERPASDGRGEIAHWEQQTIFFAMGRGVPAGAKPGVVRTIDVAATVSDLLGIEPPLQSEGRSIKWIDETR